MSTPNKRVIKRQNSGSSASSGKFNFSPSLIPDFSNGKKQPGSLSNYRQHAWETFESLSLPDTSQESWRRTDLHKLATERLKTPDKLASYPPIPDELLKPLADDEYGGQILISPNQSRVSLDEILAAQGVIFTDLKTAAQKHPEILEQIMGKIVSTDEGKFAALAGALAENGVLLYVPAHTVLDKPLHSVFWGPGAELAHFSHLLVWIGEGAQGTYVHEYASNEEESQSMHAGIVEVLVEDHANFHFVEMQSWGRHIWNFTHERATVGKSANLSWIFGGVGSGTTKSFTQLDLVGEGATGLMSGFVFTDKNQHLDLDTKQQHLAPNTTSDLLFKAVLEGHSRSVWRGMIYVSPDARNTDGYQANQNLILSDDARADSIPGLEILNNEVSCSHGSTVGNLQEEEIFYLLTRGISRSTAERLLVEGFFDPIMQRIPFEGVRTRFQQAIQEKLAENRYNIEV